VVYCANRPGPQVTELWSAPLDDSQPPRTLSADMVAGGDVVWAANLEPQISPDGQTVVYLADQTEDERYELYAVDILGAEPPRVLSGALVAGGDVGGHVPPYGASWPVFAITPDGSEAVYIADQERDGITELYASPLNP
jgi:Tol biopolymer transport system component